MKIRCRKSLPMGNWLSITLSFNKNKKADIARVTSFFEWYVGEIQK